VKLTNSTVASSTNFRAGNVNVKMPVFKSQNEISFCISNESNWINLFIQTLSKFYATCMSFIQICKATSERILLLHSVCRLIVQTNVYVNTDRVIGSRRQMSVLADKRVRCN
jgi:hypothetical protein